MRVLFIHKSLPGQFEHLIRSMLLESGHELVGVCQEFEPGLPPLSGMRIIKYSKAGIFQKPFREFVATTEEDVENGLSVAARLLELKGEGFVPDIAVAHLGWGEALYLKDVFPHCPLLGYCEFYYHAEGADAGFDPAYPLSLNDTFRIRTVNAMKLLELVSTDLGLSPTQWQRQLFPAEFRQKIAVVHEGIDTTRVCPNAAATLTLPNGQTIGRNTPVVTFAARNLEPYRGFHIFMRAVADLCRRRKDCVVLVAGGDDVSYGAPSLGRTYREKLVRELRIDLDRVHFLGHLAYPEFLTLLQISTVHVYLTVPFVLSWSVLEAMGAGCVIVASDTGPVREVLEHEVNALLVDFFDHRQLCASIERVLDCPTRENNLAVRARATILERYELKQCVGKTYELMRKLTLTPNVSGPDR